MGDMGDIFREHHKHDKARKKRNLTANTAAMLSDGRWEQHTDVHWSTTLLGDRLDFWPSRNKFQWRGKVRVGDVFGFIKNREKDTPDDQLGEDVAERMKSQPQKGAGDAT